MRGNHHYWPLYYSPLLGAMMLLLPAPGSAQSSAPELLPRSLGSWTRGETIEPVFEISATQILQEYGSLETISARYENGRQVREVTVHRMRDRVSAYGAYTFFRAGGRQIALGEGGASGDGRTIFYQGSYFVVTTAGANTAMLSALARHLQSQPGRKMLLPVLPEYIPRKGLIHGTVRFILGPETLHSVLPLASGDWAGFAYGAEAVYAEYRTGAARAKFLAVNYPTPQITAARIEEMGSLFNINGGGDSARPSLHLLREGTLLFLLQADGLSGDSAMALLKDNRYGRDLAWSEPQETMTDVEWLQTIGSIFEGAGLMTLLVLCFALVFAGFRLLIDHVWPGKVFGRPETSEIIRLNLGADGNSEEKP